MPRRRFEIDVFHFHRTNWYRNLVARAPQGARGLGALRIEAASIPKYLAVPISKTEPKHTLRSEGRATAIVYKLITHKLITNILRVKIIREK